MPSSKPGLLLLNPTWQAPGNVRACCTTRAGGVSAAPFDGLNLADHVGDDPRAVMANRAYLREHLSLPGEPLWLKQVHGVAVVECQTDNAPNPQADACVTRQPGSVCVVMTADCLPVLLCDRAGTVVGAAHAGWRGLLEGVIEQTVAAMGARGDELLAWLGPAIGPSAFEVGDEVRAAFIACDAGAADCFRAGRAGHWFADIYALARQRLHTLGVHAVSGGEHCTFAESQQFFSYRRDNVTGRMASLIWLE